ncbi:spore germination lipoprotein GerD [Effusibacillus pohliae]|uniref:spore germination lipoprotein GerD n=1 Tax=Effusibacillus pohliae TaxID=232270 RepID=UPI00037CD3C4|nr:spore germination lipoprotein GerD [Effusibacillus pohliae]
MRVRSRYIAILALAFLVSGLTSCSSGGGQSSPQKPEYNQTKAMMLDILHSKEGIDTLKDIVKEPTFKQSIVITDHDMTTAIVKTLNDEKTQKRILEAQMKDPQFAATMVKTAKKEHETMLKQLMKDPEYQQSMLALMKSPDYQQMMLSVMQSPQYRQQVMKMMAESLQNPEFKLVFMDVVKEAIRSGAGVSKMGAEEQGQKKEEGRTKKKEQEGGQDKEKEKEKESGKEEKKEDQ